MSESWVVMRGEGKVELKLEGRVKEELDQWGRERRGSIASIR